MRSSKILLCVVALVLLYVGTASADEFRGFWVDAWGAGFKRQTEVVTLLGVPGDPNSKGAIRNANCNAVFVQVRRRADVCYPSAMGEPYMPGLSPSNFNALQAIIDAAHDTTGGKQRIEVHCWIVTFATAKDTFTSPIYYQHCNPQDSENYWMTLNEFGVENAEKAFDPGHPKCEEYLVNTCMDLVNNFDIDGIHYDYIRFSAFNEGYNPTSINRYNARYGYSGFPDPNDEQFKQWRRDQVTALVRKVYAKIQSTKPWVKQSGAFVTWNPSPVNSTRAAFMNTRPYYDVYSDWDSWVQEGIVDMAVPMTYYNYASLPNDYTRWMNFEKDRKANRHMIVGPGIYLNSLTNALTELKMTRNASPAGNFCQGFAGYSYRVPYSGGSWNQFSPAFTQQVTPSPANIPVMPWKTAPTKGHMSGTVTYTSNGAWADGATVTVSGPENRTMDCDGTGFYAFIDLTPGTYTITASKAGCPSVRKMVNMCIGDETGNMYITDFALPTANGTITDTIPPSINSLNLTPSLAAGGYPVSITVSATDNVGVTSITASGSALMYTTGNLWNVNIIADKALGNHTISMTAKDAAGNITFSSDITYTTMRVMGLSNRSLTDTVTRTAAEKYLFKVWGQVTVIDANHFDLTDGSGVPIQVDCPNHGLTSGSFISAIGTRDASAPAKLMCHSNLLTRHN